MVENKGETITFAQVILLVLSRLSFYFLKSRGDEREGDRHGDLLTKSKDWLIHSYAHR